MEVDQVVRYIIRSDNVQTLSWRSKRVSCNIELKELPAIVRKVCAETMLRKYCSDETKIEDTWKVRSILFIVLVQSLTKGNRTMQLFVDYILNGLVY